MASYHRVTNSYFDLHSSINNYYSADYFKKFILKFNIFIVPDVQLKLHACSAVDHEYHMLALKSQMQ